MEHLCKSCIEMLKEHWGYIADEIKVMEVPKNKCDNTYLGRGINPYENKRIKYPLNLPIIKIKKEKDFKRGEAMSNCCNNTLKEEHIARILRAIEQEYNMEDGELDRFADTENE